MFVVRVSKVLAIKNSARSIHYFAVVVLSIYFSLVVKNENPMRRC